MCKLFDELNNNCGFERGNSISTVCINFAHHILKVAETYILLGYTKVTIDIHAHHVSNPCSEFPSRLLSQALFFEITYHTADTTPDGFNAGPRLIIIAPS